MKDNNNKRSKKNVAELDDSELEMLANYKVAKIGVIDEDPNKRYFLAIGEESDRPDSVGALLQMGYVKSDKKYFGPPGLVPLEIDRAIYEARKELEYRNNLKALNSSTEEKVGRKRLDSD